MKYRFHLLGLSHLPVSEDYFSCAYTQKIVKLARMLMSQGHEVFLYGAEGSDAPCTEFIQTHTLKDIRDAWGEGDNRFVIGYDWHTKGFKHDWNKPPAQATTNYYNTVITEINKRKKPDDFLLLTMGVFQKVISDAVNLFLTCEPGIGYAGSFTRFKAFESSYLMNFTFGSKNPGQSINGDYYSRVIPNYFDAKDFTFNAKPEDYYLYIGRMIVRKGVSTAIEATRLLGKKLILAGQTDPEINIHTLPPHCKFIGSVGPEKRNELMGNAIATFVPTLYLEPFGGVNVESRLTGTPVITTNFGVFHDIITDGLDGYRCDTLDDFFHAASEAPKLNRAIVRQRAERYLTDHVKWEYEKWWDDLYDVYESTFDPAKRGWSTIRAKEPEWRQHLYPGVVE
jgi:glycosyltransferase involved in cell wall biosynthesis